jgi:hypothetical protein
VVSETHGVFMDAETYRLGHLDTSGDGLDGLGEAAVHGALLRSVKAQVLGRTNG